jgi:hypothetical protein
MSCPGLEEIRYKSGPGLQADADGAWLRGRINLANLPESQRIWKLIHQPYIPIDWQIDFKSGYRWSEKSYFRDLSYGDRRGADVKMPWELARLQHLSQLAIVFAAARQEAVAFDRPDLLVTEFRNQVIDFVATNPPGFGINWTCAMDVAIRVANILIALDLFVSAGAELDRPFLDLVTRSAAEHGQHILANLEWAEEGRGNHYLANIVGLLFCAAYLPRTADTDAWLGFAAAEITREADLQFLPDGGNIEASSAYHRLSGELLSFASALILGLPGEEITAAVEGPLPRLAIRPPQALPTLHEPVPGLQTFLAPRFFAKLAKAAELSRDFTKPSGEIVQWGDNDSGRFVKISPPWSERSGFGERDARRWKENPLDHRSFVAGVATLTARRDLARWAGDWEEAAVISALASRHVVALESSPLVQMISPSRSPAAQAFSEDCRMLEIPLPTGVVQGVRRAAYSDFGHYAFIGPRLFLAVRCADWQRRCPPGHAHDDALALELQVDGRDLLVDPGTFVYTPLPEERNRYRAASAHFVPRPERFLGANLSLGLFEIQNLPSARCLAFEDDLFVGEVDAPGCKVTRSVRLGSDRIVIEDRSASAALHPIPPSDLLPRVCFGYGVKTTRSPHNL